MRASPAFLLDRRGWLVVVDRSTVGDWLLRFFFEISEKELENKILTDSKKFTDFRKKFIKLIKKFMNLKKVHRFFKKVHDFEKKFIDFVK